MKPLKFDLSSTLFARTKRDKKVLHRFFKSGRPRGVSAKTPVFFLQSFFFWGYFLKRKSVKRPLITKVFSRFSFEKIGTKKS